MVSPRTREHLWSNLCSWEFQSAEEPDLGIGAHKTALAPSSNQISPKGEEDEEISVEEARTVTVTYRHGFRTRRALRFLVKGKVKSLPRARVREELRVTGSLKQPPGN